MDSHCPDYTKLDGEYEDEGDQRPYVCGEYVDPYADDEQIVPVMCATTGEWKGLEDV